MVEDEAKCDFFQKYGVENLPTFLFLREEKGVLVEQKRFVGSTRGDLMGNVLQALPPNPK